MKPPDKERIQDTDDSLDGFLESPIFRLNPMFDRLEGTTLDRRYVVERELGHTTMSQVYLARALRLQGQRVVIKILSAALLAACVRADYRNSDKRPQPVLVGCE